ncbi:hypothetical protein ACLGDC_01750 [Helicobacter pylori]|uniref:hypothetical protein n=1 Tax=Helicobacter pylori TaxID=210 RepID=UPI0035A93749
MRTKGEQKHETISKLKENTQAMREQKERTLTLTRKTELKTPTRESKKSVLEPIES